MRKGKRIAAAVLCILTAASAALPVSAATIRGTVVDYGNSTIHIKAENGDNYYFSREQADVDGAIKNGKQVVITYDEGHYASRIKVEKKLTGTLVSTGMSAVTVKKGGKTYSFAKADNIVVKGSYEKGAKYTITYSGKLNSQPTAYRIVKAR